MTETGIETLARALDHHIDTPVDAGADVVEMFASVSDRHTEHLLKMSHVETLAMLTEAVNSISD